MKGGPRQELAVRRQKAEEDQRLLADDEGRIGKEKLGGVHHHQKKGGIPGGKNFSSFLSPPFLALVAANPPAVLGHYTVYMFLPAVSCHSWSGSFLENTNSTSDISLEFQLIVLFKAIFQLCEEEGLTDAHLLISILGLANTIPR